MVINKLISIKKASDLLNVHPNTLKRWDASGELKAIRFGVRGDRKYLAQDLEEFALKTRRKQKIYPSVGPVVAVSCLVLNENNQVLMGKRTALFGRNEYCFIGGSLAFGETFEETAINEARFKANIIITNPTVFCVTNNRSYMSKTNQQSITIGTWAYYISGKILAKQPDRIVDWRWYEMNNLPKPILEADRKITQCFKEKKFYIEQKLE